MRGKAIRAGHLGQLGLSTSPLGYFVPSAFVNIKWETYVIFDVFNFAMLVHVFFAFPETAGKTLEEVEGMFTDPSGPRYVGTLPWKTRIVTREARLSEQGEVDEEKMAQFEHDEGERSGSDSQIQA